MSVYYNTSGRIPINNCTHRQSTKSEQKTASYLDDVCRTVASRHQRPTPVVYPYAGGKFKEVVVFEVRDHDPRTISEAATVADRNVIQPDFLRRFEAVPPTDQRFIERDTRQRVLANCNCPSCGFSTTVSKD